MYNATAPLTVKERNGGIGGTLSKRAKLPLINNPKPADLLSSIVRWIGDLA